MVKRRYFLLSSLAVATGALGWRGLRSGSQQDAIATIVYKRLDYMKLDEAGVRQFADDLVQHGLVSPTRLKVIASIAPVYSRLTFAGDNALSHSVQHGEERIVSVYLLSSDFFQHGADLNRIVRYLGYYDAVRACGNPFARPMGMPESA